MRWLILLFLLMASPAWAVNYCNDADIIGCWMMESDGSTGETDQSSNGEDLTVSSGDTISRTTDKQEGDYSRTLVKSDEEYFYAADGGATDVSGADQKLSACFWMKLTADNTFESLITKSSSCHAERQYIVVKRSGPGNKIEFNINHNRALSNEAITVSDGWTHVCVVYNDVDMRIYIDGVLDSNGADNPKAYTGGITDNAREFRIGGQEYTEGCVPGFADVLMDDICMFSRDLSSSEVIDIYNNGCQGSGEAPGTQNLIINGVVINGVILH